MGLLLVAVFVGVSRYGSQRTHGDAADVDRYDEVVARLGEIARNPAVWTVVFVLAALGAGAIATAAVGGFDVPEEALAAFFGAALAVMGLLFAGFLFLAPYFATRNRGLGHAHGVVVGTLTVSSAIILLIATNLVFDLV